MGLTQFYLEVTWMMLTRWSTFIFVGNECLGGIEAVFIWNIILFVLWGWFGERNNHSFNGWRYLF